jgi:FtsH-binding integral membrane protein
VAWLRCKFCSYLKALLIKWFSLFIGVCGLLLAGLVQIFFPFGNLANFVISIITALIFSGYVVFDTYMIFNRLSEDEFIVASVELYMDIINLFLALLRILDYLNSSDN